MRFFRTIVIPSQRHTDRAKAWNMGEKNKDAPKEPFSPR